MISPGLYFLFEYQRWPADSLLLWEVQDLDYLALDWNPDPNSLGILPLISMLPGFNFQVFPPAPLLLLLLGKHSFQTHVVMTVFENVSHGSRSKNLVHVILKCLHMHAHWGAVRYLLSCTASGCVFNCTFMELKFNWESSTNSSLCAWFSCPKSKIHPTGNWESGTWSSLPYTLVLAIAPKTSFRATAKGNF